MFNATKPILLSRYQELLVWNFPWPIGYDEQEVEEMLSTSRAHLI